MLSILFVFGYVCILNHIHHLTLQCGSMVASAVGVSGAGATRQCADGAVLVPAVFAGVLAFDAAFVELVVAPA